MCEEKLQMKTELALEEAIYRRSTLTEIPKTPTCYTVGREEGQRIKGEDQWRILTPTM